MPEIIYKFENQNIQIFFDNMKLMGDILFSIYFDFETTSGKKIYYFDDDSCLCLVSYAFVVAFHPKLSLEKIFVVRSFNHTSKQLNDVGYLFQWDATLFWSYKSQTVDGLCSGCS